MPVAQHDDRQPVASPDALHRALRVVSFAETIGLLPELEEFQTGGLGLFREALLELAGLGLAQHEARRPVRTSADVERAAAAALIAIEGSPLPHMEWPAMSDILRDELPGLLGVSDSSVVRYRSGERETPDDVAQRLHVVTQIVSDLKGSYNDYGIRRWFNRPRAALDNDTPRDVLEGRWSADDPHVQVVRRLATSLLGPGPA